MWYFCLYFLHVAKKSMLIKWQSGTTKEKTANATRRAMTRSKTDRKRRKPTPWTPEIEAIFRQNIEMTNTSLGRRVGMDSKTVKKHRERLGLPAKFRIYQGAFHGASLSGHEIYTPPGWSIDAGPPCRGCDNFPPTAFDQNSESKRDGAGTMKRVCMDCQARVDWADYTGGWPIETRSLGLTR
jgi:hypothetical protein